MPDPTPLADADLIAYLDGELNEAAARAVEARLATDPDARRRADAFRRSFALLDALPRHEPEPGFTARTVTRLMPAGRSTVIGPAILPPRTSRLASLAMILVAGTLGVVTRLVVQPHDPPTTPLIADLPVIESLPLYIAADDLGFVRRLDTEGLFPPDPKQGGFTAPEPSPEARDKLTTAFQSLPASRRQQLRTLHTDLAALPPDERNRLGRVLERYAFWVDRLPIADRTRILTAPTADARLTIVNDAVLTDRREALPARKRELLTTLRTDERLQLLADVQATEQSADLAWTQAATHWRKLTAAGTKPWPFDQPDGAAKVDEFVRTVLGFDFTRKSEDGCRLSPAEQLDLRSRHDTATREGLWHLYGLGVWRVAERHPSLPRPRAKPLVTHPRDLAGLRMPLRIAQLERSKDVGQWPDFARHAAAQLLGKKAAAVSTDLFGPCRPGEFQEPVEAVLTKLLPMLSEGERRRLKTAEGRWPEYPDLFLRLAKERDIPVPGVTLPGPPSQWSATYGRP